MINEKNIFLNIAVLSYNRTDELKRLFESLIQVNRNDISISIYEDCSPNQEKILEICNFYKDLIHPKIQFLPADKNLGYDANLIRALKGDSEFTLLLSDDDYLDGSLLDDFITFLKNQNPKVVICPFIKHGNLYRSGVHYSFRYSVDVLYDSILFSGLVFKNGHVNLAENEYSFLKNSIYSQVYIVANSWTDDSYYYDKNIIIAGEDGENYFGKSEASKEMHELSNRKEALSNLYYQSKLQKVAFYLIDNLYPELKNSFYTSYSKRLVSQFMRIKLSSGLAGYIQALVKLKSLNLSYNKSYLIIIFAILFFPNFLLAPIYKYSIKRFRISGG
jgi:hypothetical protein